MKVEKQYGGKWMRVEYDGLSVCYGINWRARGPIRGRALLREKRRQNMRWGAPWIGPNI